MILNFNGVKLKQLRYEKVEKAVGSIEFVNFNDFVFGMCNEVVFAEPIAFKPYIMNKFLDNLSVINSADYILVKRTFPLFVADIRPYSLFHV